MEGVGEFKIVQRDTRNLEVLVVPNPRWQAEMAAAIVAGLQQRLGEDVRIEVRLVDDIPPEASGKHRYVVSHVRLEGGLGNASHRQAEGG